MLYFGYFYVVNSLFPLYSKRKEQRNMKIKYEFINGETTEIEVDETIGTFIVDSRRIEDNLARKERYHCYSSDVAWEGEDYADPDTPESLLLAKENGNAFLEAFSRLSTLQQERLLAIVAGKNIMDIARDEGKNYKTVYESIESARKKLKKFL